MTSACDGPDAAADMCPPQRTELAVELLAKARRASGALARAAARVPAGLAVLTGLCDAVGRACTARAAKLLEHSSDLFLFGRDNENEFESASVKRVLGRSLLGCASRPVPERLGPGGSTPS